MLVSVDISEKSFGDKVVFKDLSFSIQEGEKIGLIGRNGLGKTTLFNLITAKDSDYAGEIIIKKGVTIISGRQEHHGHETKSVLEYIQGDLPEYEKLTKIIDTYPNEMGTDPHKIQAYSNALERFSQLGYFNIENDISKAMDLYQIDKSKIHSPIGSLSGGQLRMVELMKIQRSRGHLALIDEPTNHMDYVAKAAFIEWLGSAPDALVVITHDRDVLKRVDRIIEIKDHKAYSYKGNYDAYLRNNTNKTINQVNEYDLSRRRIANLKEDVIRFRRLKERARDPGTIHRFKSQEQKAVAEIKILEETVKPSFWIDQESTVGMNDKLTAAYDKHKAKNIKVYVTKKDSNTSGRLLIRLKELSLGYDDVPLFKDISFAVSEGDRLKLHGRNGVGKSTIVQAIMSQANKTPLNSVCFDGYIEVENDVRIGLYEQEINPKYLSMTLNEALEKLLKLNGLPINSQTINKILSNYLFNPTTDGLMLVSRLSGGQKARLQLISMLINNPQILILDEPTNHLDLPSVEELENALKTYHGTIIYISHDSYFANKMDGEVIDINDHKIDQLE
ncbi:MAG TPA: ABC-F family ATP-binding cassette domain-containing protein [Candidatus Saccharimonadia bacterium]|nr:ABC-F family ATP-binding cassette domain-containing protein [Candidatus Saccharimonadia bacterium]